MSDRFRCPNCFQVFPKDESTLMLSSGAAVSGEGVQWSGDLEKDLPRIKRVVYCGSCRGAVDYHALLRGRLDARGLDLWGQWAFPVVALALSFGAGWAWWTSALGGVLAAVAACAALSRAERYRVQRWRLKDEGANPASRS
ncbi:MAG: hypothetical protein KGL74_08610 [Elusimicrobia bacterium]|nr:hypothetical protein [Elusimicrobiota bacterium]